MASTTRLLEDDPLGTAEQFDQELAKNMSVSNALSDLIAHVWPIRRRRIAHDMGTNNFVKFFGMTLVYIQLIMLLNKLNENGRNWDHISSIDKTFIPTFVLIAVNLFIFFISFIWACFSFSTEGGDSRLLEFDEMHRAWRLVLHATPFVFAGFEFLFVYAIVHCHLNNAHIGQGFCKAFDVDLLTTVIALVVAFRALHFLLNIFQISKHVQQPTRRRAFRYPRSPASVPLVSVPGDRRVPVTRPDLRSRQPPGMMHGSNDANTPLTLPKTAEYPDTVNSGGYALGDGGGNTSFPL